MTTETKKKVLSICTPIGTRPSVAYHRSMRNLRLPSGWSVHVLDTSEMERVEARNYLTGEAVRLNSDLVLFADDDMGFEPDTLLWLMDYDLPVVGALCHGRRPPYPPILLRKDFDTWELKFYYDYQPGRLVEVDATGGGFLLVQGSVLRAIGSNWWTKDGSKPEDFSFCSRAKDLGHRIYVDTGVEVLHSADNVPIGIEAAKRLRGNYQPEAWVSPTGWAEPKALPRSVEVVEVGRQSDATSLHSVGGKIRSALASEGLRVTPKSVGPVDAPSATAIAYPYFGMSQSGWLRLKVAPVRIPYVLSDSDRISDQWVRELVQYPQVWTPSAWSRDALISSGLLPDVVKVVPHGVSSCFVPDGSSAPERVTFGWCFLHSFYRKGGDLVLNGFKAALEANPSALLSIKTVPEGVGTLQAECQARGIDFASVEVLTDNLTDEEMAEWYRHLTVLVHPARGGSFELMPLEAGCCGVPSILPGQGAWMDYATNEFCGLLPVVGMPVLHPGADGERNGHVGRGVEVRQDTLNVVMANVATRKTWNHRVDPACSAKLLNTWSWTAVGERMHDLISSMTLQVKPRTKLLHRTVMLTGAHKECGVREYSEFLGEALVRAGVDDLEVLPICEQLPELNTGDVLFIHAEPGLFRNPETLRAALEDAITRGVRVVALAHFYDANCYKGLPEEIQWVLHREYPLCHQLPKKSVVIPHGCVPFDLPDEASRQVLREKYDLPTDKVLLTTAGFLVGWKRAPEVLEALLPWLAERWRDVALQLIGSSHFSRDEKGNVESVRSLLDRYPMADVRFVTGFLPRTELVERIAAGDLGFIYHGENTGSVSGITKQFVSARCPLVLTSSNHGGDLMNGVVRSDGLGLEAFVLEVKRLADSPENRETLRAGMEAEYKRLNIDVIAKQYLELFRG